MKVRTLSLALGTIQFEYIPQLDILEKRCEEATIEGILEAPKICSKILDFVGEIDGGLDMYDSRWLKSNSSRQEAHITEYLNDLEVSSEL